MDRKEAINILSLRRQNAIGTLGNLPREANYTAKNVLIDEISAYDMAIEALDQESMIDKLRADIISKYPKNYAGEPELGGNACEFSLNQILQIIDKYKAEMESEE